MINITFTFSQFSVEGTDPDEILDNAIHQLMSYRKHIRAEFKRFQESNDNEIEVSMPSLKQLN